MTLQPIIPLVRLQHGSHLYGTNTESSDLDLKAVHLPSGAGILLGRPEQHLDFGEKLSGGIKNEAGDVDHTSYSLSKWLHMLADGDTLATEILFAPTSFVLEEHKDWAGIKKRARGLLSKQCAGFLAYVQRQASRYGIKGSRMAACRDIAILLKEAVRNAPNARLRDIREELDAFVASHDHSQIVAMPTAQGGQLDHLDIVDRKFPLTVKAIDALNVYAGVYDQYGSRARAALGNENVDFKALSHAIRVGSQAIELMTTGELQFPRPDAEELLEIKQGKRPFKPVSDRLEALVDELACVAAKSHLPDEPDRTIADAIVIDFHKRQIGAD